MTIDFVKIRKVIDSGQVVVVDMTGQEAVGAGLEGCPQGRVVVQQRSNWGVVDWDSAVPVFDLLRAD